MPVWREFARRASQGLVIAATMAPASATMAADAELPIADVHVHYSHDSVDMTPPQTVIELMRTAGLRFALVSSSDDRGTQLLRQAAPEMIIPGLRPYRKRGELSSWYRDPEALEYVERLLARHPYATIGEFHLYGENAELEIPRRLVELADAHNLILHAHADADAVTRLLAQSDTVKVLWAHAGFDAPGDVAAMLEQHPRLWADLAFRGEVGSGGSLSDDWHELFVQFPDRLMLGTDTYTPERMFFIPEHASGARTWLSTLPRELAENIAWKNAEALLRPVWESNRQRALADAGGLAPGAAGSAEPECSAAAAGARLQHLGASNNDGNDLQAILQLPARIRVSEPFDFGVTICSEVFEIIAVQIDARMPAHGHGTNYEPQITPGNGQPGAAQFDVRGMVLHMPGTWQWVLDIETSAGRQRLSAEFMLQ